MKTKSYTSPNCREFFLSCSLPRQWYMVNSQIVHSSRFSSSSTFSYTQSSLPGQKSTFITPAINLVRRCDGSEKTYYPSIAPVIIIVQAPTPHQHRVSVAILYFFNKLRTTTDTSTKIGEHYFFFFTVFVLASTFILSFEKRISQSVCIVILVF